MKIPSLLFILLAAFLALPAHAEDRRRATLVGRVESAEAILREFMVDPATAIPGEILRNARGIVIVNQFRAGFIFGAQVGYGVILVRRPDNTWSIPAFLKAGEASVGLQVGAKSVETIYVLNNDETPRLLFSGSRFNIGVDARAAAGPDSAEVEAMNRDILDTPVLVYSRSEGLFAGATVRTGWLARDDSANYRLHNTNRTLPEILYSDAVAGAPESLPMRDFVRSISH